MTPQAAMTDEQLAAIRDRETRATKGPWLVEDTPDLNRWVTSENSTLEANFGYRGNSNRDDAEFAAHAREDIPLLLDEVARLQAIVTAAYEFADEMGDYYSPTASTRPSPNTPPTVPATATDTPEGQL